MKKENEFITKLIELLIEYDFKIEFGLNISNKKAIIIMYFLNDKNEVIKEFRYNAKHFNHDSEVYKNAD